MKVRAVVFVYDEEKLLPHYLAHYGAFCDSILVWDNGSTDRTREIAAAHSLVELRSFESDGIDDAKYLEVLAASKEMSSAFDWCIFADCDEFLLSKDGSWPRPRLEHANADVVIACGYSIVQMPGEPPLDFGRPLLVQRRHGYHSRLYSKPVAMRPRARARFEIGKHTVETEPGVRVVRDPDLVLLHFDTADFDHWLYRKTRRHLSRGNVERGWATRRFSRPREVLAELWREETAKALDLSIELPFLGRGPS